MDEVFFFSGSFGIIRALVPERSRSWLSAHAWKACNPQRFAGSNPALSANGQTYDIRIWEFAQKRVHSSQWALILFTDKLTNRYSIFG